ncbi:hypothetical protein EG329_011194 [Mollisiaceae sp. DMI_Dod_QoI]|nr:hypothetical protein EG329_011194 [Helotiales sp. DMI_Dod_QoI]
MNPKSLLKSFRTRSQKSKISNTSEDEITVSSTELQIGQGTQLIAVSPSTVEIERSGKGVTQYQLAANERSIPRPITSTPKGQCALYPLHDVSNTNYTASEGQFPIDIIAVHGIDGGAHKTWTHSNNYYWLQDSLPKDFPGARVYSFGYPAEVYFSREKSQIADFARALLEEVKGERITKEHQRRPLIFLCHSMGGIVVKKAFNISVVDHDRYESIRKAVPAIVFFATPHRGSDYANFFAQFARIANVPLTVTARFSGRTRDELIKSLGKDSTTLSTISEDFRHHTKNLKIYSFFETECTQPLKDLIVGMSSARLDVPSETTFPMLGCDHRTICRFSGSDDPKYRKVFRTLQEIATEATNNEPCLHSLSFPTMTWRQQETTLSTMHPQSCAWILTHPSYLTWTTDSSPSDLLWLKGHPGTGKSTIMSFLYTHFAKTLLVPEQQPHQHDKDTIMLGFFFHGSGSPLQRSSLGMFRSLLHQIYKQSLFARKTILEYYQQKVKESGECGKAWEWQVPELRDLFTSILTSAAGNGVGRAGGKGREQEVLVFIDALDESLSANGTKGAKELLDYFHDLSERIGKDQKGVKICVSSRHYPIVSPLSDKSIVINMEVENSRDIAAFISYQLRLGVETWAREDEQEKRDLEEALVNKAAGVFLWARLRVEKIVKGLNDGLYSLKDIKEMVEGETNELANLYEGILMDEVDVGLRDKAFLMMRWVCLAERPLTLGELRYAMACDITDDDDPVRDQDVKGFVDTDARMEKLVKSLSGGLAEVRYYAKDATVQLFHQSVNDFLTESGLSILHQATNASSEKKPADEILGESENRLSASCLTYLRLEKTIHTACLALEDIQETLVFVDYATKYWAVHAEKAERRGVDQAGVVKFFDSWSEAFETWKMIYKAIAGVDEWYPALTSGLAHTAARYNLQTVTKYLLEKDPIQEADDNGYTPLHEGARFGHIDIVSILVDHGADLDAKDWEGNTPLVVAAAAGHEDVVKLLLIQATQSDISDRQTGNALQAAASIGNASLVALLLRAGADINARTDQTVTALQAAASGGKLEVVRLLLKHGADVDTRGGYRGTPLQEATTGPLATREEIVDLLITHGADINAPCGPYGNALQAAATTRQTHIVRKLLHGGANVNKIEGKYGTALQAAASHHCEENALILIENGADINSQGGESGCPLHAAVAAGCMEIVELLLNKGADVHIRGGKYDNVVQAASASVAPETVPWLLERGARADLKGGEYGNVLQAAVHRGNVELAKAFLTDGHDINEIGGTQGTALQAAMMQCRDDFIIFLVEQGADVNGKGGEEGSPLRAAITYQRANIVRFLLERGADPNVFEEALRLCDPLQVAAARGKLSIVEALVDHGADILRQGGWFGNALSVAIVSGHKPVVKFLLDEGADWTAPAGIYKNCLAAAKATGNPNMANLLLYHPSWKARLAVSSEVSTKEIVHENKALKT